MSRLVSPKASSRISARDRGDTDSYLERVMKYVPSETLAAYVGIQSVSKGRLESNVIEWVIFLILAVGTPLYIWRLKGDQDCWRTHAFLAFLGFLVWSFALHGDDVLSPWDSLGLEGEDTGLLAGVLTILFPFIAGLVVPKSPDT